MGTTTVSGVFCWLSKDPILFAGGQANLYVYCHNDPVNYIDPFGLGEESGGFWRGVGGVVGKIWNLPNSVIGLAYGLVGVPFGADISIGHNSLQFNNHPLMPTAMALGNVTLYNGSPGFTPAAAGPEEAAHTHQGEVLGPLYLPAHLLGGIYSLITTGTWHDANPLEQGPGSDPPTTF